MRRACSSEVSAVQFPARSPDSVARSRGRARAARYSARRPAGRARRSARPPRRAADLASSDTAVGSISKSSIARRPSSVDARRCPGRVATPRRAQLEHGFGLLPGREVGELVGADQEDRIVAAAGRAAGRRCARASSSSTSSSGKAASWPSGEPRRLRVDDRLVARVGRRRGRRSASSAEVPLARRERARRGRRAAGRTRRRRARRHSSTPASRRRPRPRRPDTRAGGAQRLLELLLARAACRRRGSRGRCAGSGTRRRRGFGR